MEPKDQWPPEWFKSMKVLCRPNRVAYAYSYAHMFFPTKALRDQCIAICLLHGKRTKTMDVVNTDGTFALFVYFE